MTDSAHRDVEALAERAARGLRAAREFMDGKHYRDREFIRAELIPQGLEALDAILARLEQVEQERDAMLEAKYDPPDTAPRCDYCGLLDWTTKQYGRLTHKHDCPHRSDAWCQSHPEGCAPDTAEER